MAEYCHDITRLPRLIDIVLKKTVICCSFKYSHFGASADVKPMQSDLIHEMPWQGPKFSLIDQWAHHLKPKLFKNVLKMEVNWSKYIRTKYVITTFVLGKV